MGSLPKKNGHCTPEEIQDSSWFEGNHAVGSGAYIYPMAHSIRGNKIYTYMPHTNQEGKFTSPMAVWVSISRSTAFGIFDSKLVSSRYYLEGKGFLPIRMVSFDTFQGWVVACCLCNPRASPCNQTRVSFVCVHMCLTWLFLWFWCWRL